MVLEPIHLALWKLANVRTIWDRALSLPTVKPFVRPFIPKLKLSTPQEPDLVFVAEVYRKVEGLEKLECPKAYYIQDPHVSMKRYLNLSHLEDYDFIFITQKDYIPSLHALDAFWRKPSGTREEKWSFSKAIHWLPVAFDPDIILGPERTRDIPVCFIGSRDGREDLLKVIEKFGGVVPHAYLRNMASILGRSKVAFNVSRNGDLNPRVFEGMGAGAMVLTDIIENGLLELFIGGTHLAVYERDQSSNLEAILSDYLAHREKRELMAYMGQKLAFEKHTYLDRALHVIETCLPQFTEGARLRLAALKSGMVKTD